MENILDLFFLHKKDGTAQKMEFYITYFFSKCCHIYWRDL